MEIMVGLGSSGNAALLLYLITKQLGWIAGQSVTGSCSLGACPPACSS
jgi:hypothetical protein